MKRIIIFSAILLFATITMAQVSESSLSYREYILQEEIMYDVLGMYLQSDNNSSYTDDVMFHNAHENNFARRNNRPLLKSASTEVEPLRGFVEYKDGNATTKVRFQYDSVGNPGIQTHFLWDNSQSAWVSDYKEMLDFDENGNWILLESYNWKDSLSGWEVYSRYESSYDENGNTILYVGYLWDEDTESWAEEPNSKIVSEYYYNENSADTLSIATVYPNGSEANSFSKKTKCDYDSLGNLISSTVYMLSDGIWTSDSKEIYNYDYSSNLLITKQNYRWDHNIDDWEKRSTEKYFYDENENCTSIVQKTNAASGEVLQEYSTKYGYDLSYPKGWLPFPLDHQNRLKSMSYAYKSGSEYVSIIDSFYYSEEELEGIGTNGVKFYSSADFAIYPNPVNDVLNINAPASHNSTYSILNLSGKAVVKEQTVTTAVDVSGLPSGTYFIQINNGEKVETLKFVKE